MRRGLVALAILGGAAALFVAVVHGGAAGLRAAGRHDDEIAWLEAFAPALGWQPGYEDRIGRRYRERVRRGLDADRVDQAAAALRLARRRDRALGLTHDRELVALGIETFTRAADRLEAHGQLAAAADWDDSLFVFAIRAAEPHHRYAATAAFLEGLDLRVRAGRPCEALARVRWATRGLGGVVPGLPAAVEEDLDDQCRRSRARGRRR